MKHYATSVFAIILLLLGLAIFFVNDEKKERRFVEIKQDQEYRFTEATFKTIEWYELNDEAKRLQQPQSTVGQILNGLTSLPASWSDNPVHSIYFSNKAATKNKGNLRNRLKGLDKATAIALQNARNTQNNTQSNGFSAYKSNQKADAAVSQWRGQLGRKNTVEKKANTPPYNNGLYLLGLFVFIAFITGILRYLKDLSPIKHIIGLGGLFLLTVLSFVLGAHESIEQLVYIPFLIAIGLGLLINYISELPKWLEDAMDWKIYLSLSLVLAGAEIRPTFAIILAFIVTVIFYFSEKQKDSEFSISLLWKRIPKVFLAFIMASILIAIGRIYLGSDIATLVIDNGLIESFSKNLRNWLICLGLLSIVLKFRIKDLKSIFNY